MDREYVKKSVRMSKRPYVIVHMMESVDGRIDCAMTEQIDPTSSYYDALEQLGCDSQLMGRVTMQMHYAEAEPFRAADKSPMGEPASHKAADGGYTVALDTLGKLRWGAREYDGRPLLVITSEDCPRAYLDELTRQGISWMATGRGGIDLPDALERLGRDFGVKRLAITGGGHINGSLLAAGLVDEVSVMIGPGIDGRRGMTSVFDGIDDASRPATLLRLDEVLRVGDTVWLRYSVKR